MGCHQYTTSSNSTTLESNKSVRDLLTDVERNEQRKKQQAEKGLDALTFFVFTQLDEQGVQNAESVSKRVGAAFTKFSNWQQSEKELRELRKQVTFAIFAEEDDLEKVTPLVESLFTTLQRTYHH